MPARAAEDSGQRAGSVAAAEWARLQVTAPQVVLTIHRYLRQLGTFLAPRSVTAAEGALRQFARWLVTEAQITAVANIRRDDIEDYKVWLAGRHRSIESTRVYLHLANDWLADQYLRAAELIDADTAAVAEMLAVQEVAAR